MAVDIVVFLREGMAAIYALLDDQEGPQGVSAARELADAMKGLHLSPMALDRTAQGLRRFREQFPKAAAEHLPQTFAWLDR
ncbi:MAG: hypothetical protein AAFW87_08020 [Pseudomonadota bacterium]